MFAVLATFSGSAYADGPAPTPHDPERGKSSVEGEVAPTQKHWLRKLASTMSGRPTSPYARDGSEVLEAFEKTVSFPAQCTVRIRCEGKQVALGTIIDSAGLIATKGSELGKDISCELRDGKRYTAQVLGMDRGSDLALLKIPARDLPAIEWSKQDPPAVGRWVITPGLSDTPQAIGIVSVAAHPVRGGVLGIQMTEDEAGPRITYVVPDSGAAAAGLARGDIILRAGDKTMERADDMVDTTSQMLPGDKLELSIQRHGEKKKITATLGSVADTLSSRRARFQGRLGTSLSKRRFLFPSALEHDSELAPNHCGGVLVNLDGKAIGLNIARASRISCYAIPARIARRILKSLASQHTESSNMPLAARDRHAPLEENNMERELGTQN